MESWGTLHLRNIYVLSIPRLYPCAPMVTDTNNKYSRFQLGPVVSQQLAIGGADEYRG